MEHRSVVPVLNTDPKTGDPALFAEKSCIPCFVLCCSIASSLRHHTIRLHAGGRRAGSIGGLYEFIRAHSCAIPASADNLRGQPPIATHFFEQNLLQPWSVDSTDRDFLSRLVEGIVGFTIEIEGIQGYWKLNQHHSESRRRGVIAGLKDRGRGDDTEIARLMKEADG